MPMPCSPGDHPAEGARELHDARHRRVGLAQHLVVVGVHRDVGVHVAVAGVHVQRHEDARAQHLGVDRLDRLHHRLEVAPGEDVAQRLAQLRLPRDARAVQLHGLEHGGVVEALEGGAPARGHLARELQRAGRTVAQQVGAPRAVARLLRAPHRHVAREERLEAAAELELVADRELDVDALDAVGVVAQALERDHHVLVDLEGVGVARDGGGARAVEPEALPLLRRHGDEALAVARVGDAHHVRGGLGRGVLVVAHDVGDEDHARPSPALRLGGVADRLHVALVQVLEAGEDRLRVRFHVALHLDDGGHRPLHVAEELEAHRAHVLRHAVQDEGRRGDEAVAAFLLHAGEPREELVGHVLAEALLAQALALDLEHLLALRRHAVRCVAREAEARARGVVDAAAVVPDALHVEPLAVGGDHAPGSEVVQCRAPQHGLLAARVHRDVAADARGVRGRGIAREHEARGFGRLHRALGDHSRAAADHRHFLGESRQHAPLDGIQGLELLGVHHRGEAVQRDRPARVAGAAAARDDGEAELHQRAHQRSALLLGVGTNDDEGILDAPVRGVGHMRDAREAVEGDVVAARDGGEAAHHLPAQLARLGELALEGVDRARRELHQLAHLAVALGLGVAGAAPPLDLAQAMAHRAHQQAEPPRAVQQVVLQVRVAAHDPDVAQHLVEHARRAPGAPLRAQLLQRAPARRAKQPHGDLAVGERRVVVRDFPQARGHVRSIRGARKHSILPHCNMARRL